MSTLQSTSVRILIDFNNFWPVVTLFHNFLGFHMILTSKYCDSDEEFIKNSPLLNAFSNSTPDSTPTHTWIFCLLFTYSNWFGPAVLEAVQSIDKLLIHGIRILLVIWWWEVLNMYNVQRILKFVHYWMIRLIRTGDCRVWELGKYSTLTNLDHNFVLKILYF